MPVPTVAPAPSMPSARVLVVVFIANGCPTVRLYEQRLVELHHRFHDRGLQIVLVNCRP